jgi:hypothetical protein
METFFSENLWLIVLLIILSVWELVWKMIAFWKSARGSQLAWFVCIGLFNTVGILPIIYLIWFQKKPVQTA